ncbi:DUF1376 domain-containing protein [Sulfitobacter sp. EhC04]|uniref:DUF1376 domain-containing protein n=1 Tax=Sulfitobacter sp. EhC04 TaxID=1849168 RepID=UPI001372A5CC|nr:DUF1376 domain-containing protein [Sulfitobacter sp. EhC04]
MKHGSDWYKREPTAYLGGVQGLTAKEHAVYSVTLDLIYAHGGSVNNDPGWISGWIKDMGSAAVRKAISSLVERGKLFIDGDQISQKRAKTEAKTKENVSETARESGKKGGKKSAEKRAAIKENNHLGEAGASSENQADKIREDKIRDDDDSAGAKNPDLDHRQRILAAIGVDPVSGLTGHGGKMLGGRADMAHVDRWRALGVADDEQRLVVAEVMARKRNGPPSSFAYFDQAMEELAGLRNTAPLAPKASTDGRAQPPPGGVKFDLAALIAKHPELDK